MEPKPTIISIPEKNNHTNKNTSEEFDGQKVGRMWHNFTASLGLRNSTMDKTVASQVLMYRQLLHTNCRPGLRLSRAYEGTAAQRAVLHMPWWERGILQSQKMCISYSNLIGRLWHAGAVKPFVQQDGDLLSFDSYEDDNDNTAPIIPHVYWVERVGFQQDDPVTDFRSGGVLSLALCVHLVEACPQIHARFLPGGDTEVMPFGITSINVTDMIAKMLMFSKSIDKLDALVSSKPFWRMFADPSSLLVLQEISMDFLCDVSNEIKAENDSLTVFDFNIVMEGTEKRVNALLNYGPETIHDMRKMHATMKERYKKRLERKLKGEPVDSSFQQLGNAVGTVGSITGDGIVKVAKVVGTVGVFTGAMIGSAGNAAGGMLSKLGNNTPRTSDPTQTQVDEEEWTRSS